MATRTQAKLSGNAAAWVRAVVTVIVDGGDPPPSRNTLYKRVPQQVGGGPAAPVDGGPSAKGDGRSTAALNGLPEKNYQAGQRIWIDEVTDELIDQDAVTEQSGALRWARDLHRDMTVTFHGMTIRVDSPEERQRSDELGAIDLTLRGAGHLNRVLIADGGGISGNPRYRAGERVALEVHPLAYEIPPMGDAELEAFAKDARKHGILTPLLLIPDHDDPIRKQTAKPGEQPLVLDKNGNAIPKLKVGDGRHRLFIASQFNLPVRLELFEGDEQQARERIVSLNVRRRMLHPVTIAALVRKVLLPAEKIAAEDRRREGNRKGGLGRKFPTDVAETSPVNGRDGEAEKRVLDAIGNPIGTTMLRGLKPLDDAPETMEKALRGEYKSANKARVDAEKEIAEREGRPVPDVPPRAKSRGDRYSTALYNLRQAYQEFDPEATGTLPTTDRVARLEEINDLACNLIMLEKGVA